MTIFATFSLFEKVILGNHAYLVEKKVCVILTPLPKEPS